jgi:glycosyltransferase 2 family protein
MQTLKKFFWPVVGLIAVALSVDQLYTQLKTEAATDPAISALLAGGNLWSNIGTIAGVIGRKLAAIPPMGYVLAALSTLVAYAALAWYDRIALLHLGKTSGISWFYISVCSFTTYALSHNIGVSVLSGGMVRYRAYTAKGLNAAEIAVLVALTSFTFTFGTVLLGGLVLIGEPDIVTPLAKMPQMMVVAIGFAMLAFCALYALGSYLKLKPLMIRGFKLEYPAIPIVVRQLFAAPLELLGAAGIIYFTLPEMGNPGFFVVLGAFLLSFSAGLLFQVPGGIGVMEAVFIAVMPQMPATAVFAALLVWRLFYLLIPLAISIPVVILFERSQLGKATKDVVAPKGGH